MSFDDLDGRTFFAFTSRHAFGCGGWEDPDYDEQGRGTFVVLGDDAAARVEAIEDTWDTLWLKYPTLDTPSRTATMDTVERLTGGRPVMLTLTAPRWNAAWPGTLKSYWEAREQYGRHEHAAVAGVNDALRRARLALFASIGAVPTALYVRAGRNLVHDFGCRCSHSNSSEGQGTSVVRVRGGRVYLTEPMDVAEFDTLVAEAESAARVAAEEAREKLANETKPKPDLAEPNAYRHSAEGDLTYEQWVNARTERAEQIAAALSVGDEDRLKEFGYTARHWSPDQAAQQARTRILGARGIDLLSGDEADELARILRG